jgi:hypothetical protein
MKRYLHPPTPVSGTPCPSSNSPPPTPSPQSTFLLWMPTASEDPTTAPSANFPPDRIQTPQILTEVGVTLRRPTSWISSRTASAPRTSRPS